MDGEKYKDKLYEVIIDSEAEQKKLKRQNFWVTALQLRVKRMLEEQLEKAELDLAHSQSTVLE